MSYTREKPSIDLLRAHEQGFQAGKGNDAAFAWMVREGKSERDLAALAGFRRGLTELKEDTRQSPGHRILPG